MWAGSKQRELGLNGLQLLHQVSPCSVVLLALLIPCLEPVGFSSPGPGTVLGYHLTPAAGFWIVVSSVLGLVVTLSTFLFIGATSRCARGGGIGGAAVGIDFGLRRGQCRQISGWHAGGMASRASQVLHIIRLCQLAAVTC